MMKAEEENIFEPGGNITCKTDESKKYKSHILFEIIEYVFT